MIKRIFLALLPVVLLIALFPSKAFATSSADSVLSLYSGSTPFEINSYGGTCTPIASTDGQLDLNSEAWWHTIWQYTADYPSGMASQIQGFWNLYHDNLSVGSGWAFSRDSSNLMTVTVWSNPSTAVITLDSSGLHISGGTAYTLKLWLHDGHSCSPFIDSSSINNYLPTSGLILFAGDIQYPDGYAGVKPPDTLTENKHYSPRASYSVKGQHVDGLWCVASSELCNLPPGVPVNLVWHIEDSTGDTIYTPDHASNFQNDGGVFKYDFPGLGKYYLVGVWSAPIPYIQPSDQTWDTTRLPVDINGGNYVSGTYGQGCDNGGTCSDPFVYEDCTTYGTDLIGGFNCIVNNFKTWLTITADSLFVPSYESMQSLGSDFNTWANTHLGALIQFFTWFGSLTPSITSGASDIVCTHDFGTFFGTHFVFNQCVLEQKYPQIWGVITLVVRGTAVFMVLLMIYQKIKYIIGASKEVS